MQDLPSPAAHVPAVPPEVTAIETARSAAADLADLAAGLPGTAVSDAARSARVADRLAEELAELSQMLRALPSRPAGMSGHDHQLLAALRTARAAGEDVAEFVARGLARLASELGGSYEVIRNRDGSWEASVVAQLLRGTVGDDEALGAYRTTQ
jgi:ABC-type transporter Mla subunit MlaD